MALTGQALAAKKGLFSRMLMMLSFPDSQSQQSSGLRPRGRETIEHPKPPQVGIEVLGGDALEAAHPAAQAADIGVDVLHMPGAPHAYAAADVDGLVLYAQGMRRTGQGDAAIGAQDRIGRQQGGECRLHAHCLVGVQDDIGRGPCAVTRHQDGRVLPALGAGQRLAATPARLAQQPPLALAGDPEIGLIGLGNAAQLARLHALGTGQEPVTPAKGGGLRHAQAPSHLVEREAFAQGGRVRHPFVSQMQPGQGRSGQGVEGALALAALEALQRIGRAVLDDRRAMAVRACRVRARARFDDLAGLAARAQQSKRCCQLLVLVVRQLEQAIEQTRHLLLFHDRLLMLTPWRHASKMGASGRRKSPYH